MFSDYRRDLGMVYLMIGIGLTMLLYSRPLQAQNSVGIGTNAPNKHAVLELASPNNNQGLLLPRLTTAQRTNPAFTATLSSTDNGLIIFDKTNNQFYYWKDSQWAIIGESSTSTNGSAWRSGAGLPADNLGTTGDFYLDSSQGIIYKKEDGTYKLTLKIAGQPGPQGLTGPVGPQGLAGQKGDTGPQGLSGIPGMKGNTGEHGIQGIKGDIGPQGLPGIQGDKGDIGPQGLQGIAGTQGIQGLKGEKGDQGNAGLTGPQGDNGTQGLPGLKGDTGNTGAQGVAGAKGDDGAQGIQGLKGEQGNTGAQGLQGIPGVKGDKGDTGDTGAQGLQGIQGLKGDTGDRGAQGLAGTKGDQGNAGLQGLQGIPGLKGDQGDTGLTGLQGPAGNISALTDSKILVGNAANTPTEVKISQDGDLDNTGALTVTGLRNIPMAAITPTNGQVLQMNGSTWTPTTITGVLSGGTTDYLPKWSSANSLTNSKVLDNGTDVGIGTTTPDAALHIRKDGAVTQEVSMLILEANNGGGGSGPVLHFRNKPAASVNYMAAIAVIDSANDARMEFRVVNDNLPTLAPLTKSSTRMVIVDNGNVGIGNNTPAQKLTVAGTLGIIETGTLPSHYTIFQGGDQATNITYTLPTTAPTANGQVLTSTTNGVMTWSTSSIIKLTLSVNIGIIPANGYVNQTFTVSGATAGSSVAISPANDLPDNVVIAYARVSAADTVTVRFMNTGGGAQDLVSMNYYLSVIK
jgi:hypothetical protein